MSRITITIKTSTVEITERFDTKKYGNELAVLKAAIKWLVAGTPLEKEILPLIK